ncbi:MAG: MinD/ParA family protein [Candidatus Auribacterota bacterium]
MNDQASQLRNLVKGTRHAKKVRTIAVSSGKGGVGKTSICVNLAFTLASMRKRVLIFDADMGLANIDVLLGIHPAFNLSHVIQGSKSLHEIIASLHGGVKLIPGASGAQFMSELSMEERKSIIQAFAEFNDSVDYLLIDTAAGITKNVTDFIIAAGELIVVATPDPTSITDAYALMKVVLRSTPDLKVSVFINQVTSLREAQEVDEKLQLVTQRFLGKTVKSIGFMQKDSIVVHAIRKQEPFVLYDERCQPSAGMRLLASRLCQSTVEEGNTLVEFAEKLTGAELE